MPKSWYSPFLKNMFDYAHLSIKTEKDHNDDEWLKPQPFQEPFIAIAEGGSHMASNLYTALLDAKEIATPAEFSALLTNLLYYTVVERHDEAQNLLFKLSLTEFADSPIDHVYNLSKICSEPAFMNPFHLETLVAYVDDLNKSNTKISEIQDTSTPLTVAIYYKNITAIGYFLNHPNTDISKGVVYFDDNCRPDDTFSNYELAVVKSLERNQSAQIVLSDIERKLIEQGKISPAELEVRRAAVAEKYREYTQNYGENSGGSNGKIIPLLLTVAALLFGSQTPAQAVQKTDVQPLQPQQIFLNVGLER